MTFRSRVLTLVLCSSVQASQAVRAIEEETVTAIALQAQHRFAENYRVDVRLVQRWSEVFQSGERGIFQLSLSKGIDQWQFAGGYNQHFNRSVPGSEHRLWQQVRYTFDLGTSDWESSLRVEERYFTDNQETGGRLRLLNRWSHQVGSHDEISIGHEWVFNMNDIGTVIRRGVSQNRLISGLEHTLASGNRLDFQYQLRYVHVPASSNRIQHQLQLTYLFNF